MDESNPTQKVVMLGDSGVGKTSILIQLREKTFKRMATPTVGAGVFDRTIVTANGPVHLKIWDTAGEERYKAFTGLYSREATAGVIVFDVTDQKSFDNLDSWINVLKENADENVKIFIAGNKIDLGDLREINTEKAKQFAVERECEYYEVSAKTSENVDVLFLRIAKQIGPKNVIRDTIVENEGARNSCC